MPYTLLCTKRAHKVIQTVYKLYAFLCTKRQTICIQSVLQFVLPNVQQTLYIYATKKERFYTFQFQYGNIQILSIILFLHCSYCNMFTLIRQLISSLHHPSNRCFSYSFASALKIELSIKERTLCGL